MSQIVPQRASVHKTSYTASGDVVLWFDVEGVRHAFAIDDIGLNFLAHLLPRELWRREEAETNRAIQRIENADHSESSDGTSCPEASPQQGQQPSPADAAALEGER